MSEVIFKCPSCSKNLCAGDTAIGKSFDCPACRNKVTLSEPDFIFNCPSCNCDLSASKSMARDTFNCPSCENEFTIPTTGEQFIRPLKQKTISIICPSCSVELELENKYYMEVEGKTIDCPECKKAISIPSTSATTKSAINPPQWPTTPKCPGCNAEMPNNAVICVACGFDLRTGHKLTFEPQKKSRLSFKQQESPPPSVEPSNPIFDRFPIFQIKQPSLFDKFIPALKAVAFLVIIGGSGLALMHFLDVPGLLKKYKEVPAQIKEIAKSIEEPLATKPEIIVTPLEKLPVSTNVKAIIDILEKLRGSPGDTNVLQDLREYIVNVTDSNDGRLIKCGMKTIYALGQYQNNNEQFGASCCNHIQQTYPDLEFTQMVRSNQIYDNCPKCTQKGEVRENCKSCSGSKMCANCGGDGTITKQVVTKASQGLRVLRSAHDPYYDHDYHPNLLSKHTSGRAPSRVSNQVTPAPTITQVERKCTNCDGRRMCPVCKGVGYKPVPCENCYSRGRFLSKAKATMQCNMAITRVISLLEQRVAARQDIEIIETAKLDDNNINEKESSEKEATPQIQQK